MKKNNNSIGINKNILLVLVMVPILIALGVVIGNYLSNADVVTAEFENKKETLEETVPLDEFVLNLEPTGNVNRYIRLELSLSTTHENGVEAIDKNMDKIRDVIIYEVSRQSVEKVFLDENNDFALKSLLKNEVNKVLNEEIVHQVYIRNLIIQ